MQRETRVMATMTINLEEAYVKSMQVVRSVMSVMVASDNGHVTVVQRHWTKCAHLCLFLTKKQLSNMPTFVCATLELLWEAI